MGRLLWSAVPHCCSEPRCACGQGRSQAFPKGPGSPCWVLQNRTIPHRPFHKPVLISGPSCALDTYLPAAWLLAAALRVGCATCQAVTVSLKWGKEVTSRISLWPERVNRSPSAFFLFTFELTFSHCRQSPEHPSLAFHAPGILFLCVDEEGKGVLARAGL